MEYTKPNLATGYARDSGMSLYPNLWQNLIAYFSPSMGKTGSQFIDWTRTFAPAPFPTAGSLVSWKDDGPDGGPCVEFGFYNSGYNVNNKGLLFNTLNSGQTAYPPNFIGNGSFVNGYSFSWWFKTGDTSQNMQFFLYGQQSNFQDSANYLYYFYRPGNNDCNITGWTGQNATALASSNICNNKWHQMAFVVGKSTTWLYLDGRLIGSQTTNNYNLTLPAWMAIGAPGNVGNNIWRMGDFGIWNRALDASEIRQLYTGASPLQSLARPTVGVIATNDTETPSTLSLSGTLLAPSINFDFLNSVSVQNLTANLISPTIRIDCTVTPGVLSLTSTFLTPSEIVDCTVT
ncbi:MAG: LamG domain-containing protein, partial [Ginsengibacter sp.]